MKDQLFLIERRGFLRAGAVLSLGALAGCTTSNVLSPATGTGSDQTAASLGYVNVLRKNKGLSPLVADKAASAAAMSQAARMAKVGKMQHLIGWNDSFYDRMKSQGVVLPAAENIAVGQDDAERAYDAGTNRRSIWKTCSATIVVSAWPWRKTPLRATGPIGPWCWRADRSFLCHRVRGRPSSPGPSPRGRGEGTTLYRFAFHRDVAFSRGLAGSSNLACKPTRHSTSVARVRPLSPQAERELG